MHEAAGLFTKSPKCARQSTLVRTCDVWSPPCALLSGAVGSNFQSHCFGHAESAALLAEKRRCGGQDDGIRRRIRPPHRGTRSPGVASHCSSEPPCVSSTRLNGRCIGRSMRFLLSGEGRGRCSQGRTQNEGHKGPRKLQAAVPEASSDCRLSKEISRTNLV